MENAAGWSVGSSPNVPAASVKAGGGGFPCVRSIPEVGNGRSRELCEALELAPTMLQAEAALHSPTLSLYQF